MDNKENIVLSCNTLGTTVPEAWQNLQMSSPTLTMDNIESVDEQESLNYPNNCGDSSERLQSSEYVNYYDNESYVLEQLKTEFPEDVLPQSDCSVNSKIHSENEKLLEVIVKAELNYENIEDGLSLNIKEENDYSEYQFIVKKEGLEEQEEGQGKFYHKTLKNRGNLLQNSIKHVKVEINALLDNGITELHQCQYCGKEFDNYNNMLVHINNDHKQEKSKCDICEKQNKSVGHLNRHSLALHILDKPLEPITENCVNCHVDTQHKCPLNDHSELSCSDKEDGEDESENKVTRNITNYDYGTTIECCCGKQHRSPIHLTDHQKVIHRPKISKTNNETLQCNSCKKSFKTKCTLTRHIKRVHVDYGRIFKCWCMKEFRSPIHLNEHERAIHRRNVRNINNDKIQCDYCKTSFTTKSNLLVHIKRLHYDYGKRFDCWCGKQFRSPFHLRDHERIIHQRDIQNINNGKFQCESCKIFLKTRTSLLAHIKRLHYNYGKRFYCWCGKQFRSPIHLRDHERIIHQRDIQNINNDKFQCDYCKIFFKTKTIILAHIKRVHYDYGKRFYCWCGKQFRSPMHLRDHDRSIHQRDVQNINNGKFQCDYCKIFFKSKRFLFMHIKRRHCNYEKRFDCWCGKQFRSPLHLHEHKRRVHRRNI